MQEKNRGRSRSLAAAHGPIRFKNQFLHTFLSPGSENASLTSGDLLRIPRPGRLFTRTLFRRVAVRQSLLQCPPESLLDLAVIGLSLFLFQKADALRLFIAFPVYLHPDRERVLAGYR